MPVDSDWPLRAAAAVARDLEGRRGIGHEWYLIDDDVQDEIVQTWANIIVEHMVRG